ncbi:hypothetical protein IQ268_08465 [Oculatella sp. LEGE 06141]|nr:hypothetical protein [Oculatella sp. LEGE 06141]MBE9178590.1 hypothetical protein [Oculatella sp. LEGE 06141]
MFRGAAAPNPALFSLLLCNPVAPLTRQSSAYDVIASEVAQTTGYVPQPYLADVGTYDSVQKRFELPSEMLTFSAAGGTIQFVQAVLWQGRSGAANKPIAAVDLVNSQLQVAAHGGTDGDRVIVTSSDTVPGGIAAQIYYLKSVSANLIELYQDQALLTKVNLTNAGAGDHTLRFANGYPVWVATYDLITISDGNTETIAVEINVLNSGNANGV